MSPTGILLAGVGASVGILAGGGILGAVVLGAVGWGARVVAAVMRRPAPERIDPFTVQDPWRTMVRHAVATAARFDDAVRQTPSGPLHDRLAEVAGRVHAAVREGWAIAKRGNALDHAVANLDMGGIQRQLANAGNRDDDPVVRSLRQQLASCQRLAKVADDARERLRRLDAELDESVARAVELSLSSADLTALQPLGSDVENVVSELESLRQALEESEGGATGAPKP
jgi:hypothetical protein